MRYLGETAVKDAITADIEGSKAAFGAWAAEEAVYCDGDD